MIYYDIIYKDQYVYQFKMYVFLEEEEAEEEEEKGEEETEEEEGTLKYGGEAFFWSFSNSNRMKSPQNDPDRSLIIWIS